MALSKYERENTIKTDVDYKMSGAYTDPSGNVSYIHVIKPDGTYLVSGGNGIRDSTGQYHYFFKAGETDPLGIYVIEWYAYHNLGGGFGNMKLVQREPIQIVFTEH
jgi:hypothetical protein